VGQHRNCRNAQRSWKSLRRRARPDRVLGTKIHKSPWGRKRGCRKADIWHEQGFGCLVRYSGWAILKIRRPLFKASTDFSYPTVNSPLPNEQAWVFVFPANDGRNHAGKVAGGSIRKIGPSGSRHNKLPLLESGLRQDRTPISQQHTVPLAGSASRGWPVWNLARRPG
jgi:hypothetical protein